MRRRREFILRIVALPFLIGWQAADLLQQGCPSALQRHRPAARQRSSDVEARLGVLGGMGPLATADFLAKLTRLTPASVDQDHIPAVIYSATQTPDRSASITGRGPSPRQALTEGARFLAENGAACIAIPCNTAHFWYGDIQRSVDIPILHIVDAVCERVKLALPNGGRLGL